MEGYVKARERDGRIDTPKLEESVFLFTLLNCLNGLAVDSSTISPSISLTCSIENFLVSDWLEDSSTLVCDDLLVTVKVDDEAGDRHDVALAILE